MSEQASNKAGNDGRSVTVALPVRRVLVCGGRSYGMVPNGCLPEQSSRYSARAAREQFILRETLDDFHRTRGPFTCLNHGAAPGADAHAANWAINNRVPVRAWKADWKGYGNAAGPVRNQQMIDAGKPDLVIAFPGGRGTADMVQRARAAGIEVFEVQTQSPSPGVPVRA